MISRLYYLDYMAVFRLYYLDYMMVARSQSGIQIIQCYLDYIVVFRLYGDTIIQGKWDNTI